MIMKAYKVFNPDWTCKDFQYEVGKTYKIEGEPIMCERGFHACKKIADCFNYYSFNPENKVAEVELSGVVLGKDENKQCCSEITIVKELSWNEMLILANSGTDNTGHSNSGHWNSGDRNSGNSNSGHRNSGYSNSGHRNSGNWNSGNGNSGHRNSGHSNSGDWNSGNCNSGDSNSGHRNSGHSNSGNLNSGNGNSGNWNSGNWNSGYFNSDIPTTIRVFNKKCKKELWDNVQKPDFINNVIINKWIYWDDMTDKEKKQYPNAFVCNGYLKTYDYKEAWQDAFSKATIEDINILKSLPNFDAKVFEEISGIKV